MTAGALIVIVYWVIYTIKKGFSPKLAAATKANAYDLNGNNPDAKKAAERKRGMLTVAKYALRVAGWIETGLLVLLIVWLAVLSGALISGTMFLFGYPV